jgi:hypothetical protein
MTSKKSNGKYKSDRRFFDCITRKSASYFAQDDTFGCFGAMEREERQ